MIEADMQRQLADALEYLKTNLFVSHFYDRKWGISIDVCDRESHVDYPLVSGFDTYEDAIDVKEYFEVWLQKAKEGVK